MTFEKTTLQTGVVTTTTSGYTIECNSPPPGVPTSCWLDFGSSTTYENRTARETSVSLSSVNGNRKDPNPFSMTKVDDVFSRGTDRFEVDVPSYLGTTPYVTLINGPSVATPSLGTEPIAIPLPFQVQSDCIEAMYEKLRGTLDLSVSIAESGQTVRMLRDASKLAVAIRSISPKVWAKRWLSYKYGWAPLASDLYESANRIMRNDYDRYTVITIRKRATGTSRPTDPDVKGLRTLSRRCLLRCEYQLSNPTLTQELAGWTSLNPLSIAWELMPYSFVVDWFLDIGGYIRTLESSFTYRNSFRRGFVTHTSRDFKYGDLLRYTVTPSSRRTEVGHASRCISTIERSPIFVSPVASLPRFKADLGASRLITLASLLVSSHK